MPETELSLGQTFVLREMANGAILPAQRSAEAGDQGNRGNGMNLSLGTFEVSRVGYLIPKSRCSRN